MSHNPYEPPVAPLAEAVRSSSPLQRALTFVVGSAVFTVIFWTLWSLVLRNILTPSPSTAPNTKEQAATQAQDELMRKYQQQAQDADEMQNEMRKQIETNAQLQKRQTELVTRQEEQARRFDEVLRRWEAQAGMGKR